MRMKQVSSSVEHSEGCCAQTRWNGPVVPRGAGVHEVDGSTNKRRCRHRATPTPVGETL